MHIEHSWTIHIVKRKLKICLEILISHIINVAHASQSLAKLKYRTENKIIVCATRPKRTKICDL